MWRTGEQGRYMLFSYGFAGIFVDYSKGVVDCLY